MNPAESLARLAADLEAAGPPPDSPERHFCEGVRRWLSGESDSLDEALELKGETGIEKPRTIYLRSVRDRHLRAAHAICDGARCCAHQPPRLW